MNYHSQTRAGIVLCAIFGFVQPNYAQTSIPSSTPVVQNFESLGNSVTAALPSGWKFSSAGNGTSANWFSPGNETATTEAASNGTPTAGGRYNWGSNPATDRAIGFMTDDVYTSTNNIMAAYKNTTGAFINSLDISFNIERYVTNTSSCSVAFFTSRDGVTWISQPIGDVPATVFNSGLKTYSFDHPATITKRILLSNFIVENNGEFYLRWVFTNEGNTNAQGFGLDDVSITANTSSPVLTANLGDHVNDVNGNGIANPGETITYKDTIRNAGSVSAMGLALAHTLSGATVNGQVKTSALARDDNYSTTGNPVVLTINATTQGLLNNDYGLPAITVVSFGPTANGSASLVGTTGTTNGGGTLTVNANGTFTYTPMPQFIGIDRFKYIATTAVGLPDNDAIVSIAVGTPAVAVADVYNVVGNVSIQPSGAYNLLANDAGLNKSVGAINGDAAKVGVATLTAGGGNLLVSANGDFTYDPAPGYNGTDHFSYTIDNGLQTPGIATVTLQVAGMVWFITSTGVGTGDGRLSNPFKSISSFNLSALPGNNENIFMYEGNYYQLNSSLVLKPGQKLIGGDATESLEAITNLHPNVNYSAQFPATNSSNATIVEFGNASIGGNKITLAVTGNNLIQGMTVTTSSGAAISTAGPGTGNHLVKDVFIKISINATGISLTNLTGSFTYSGLGSIISGGSFGSLFRVDGGSANIDVGASIINTCLACAGGDVINISNTTSNFIKFHTGTISSSGSTTGLFPMRGLFFNNVNSDVTFSNGMSITAASGSAFNFTNCSGNFALGTINGNGLSVSNFSGTFSTTSGNISGGVAISGAGAGQTISLALTSITGNIGLTNCTGTATIVVPTITGSFTVSGGNTSVTYTGNISGEIQVTNHSAGTFVYNGTLGSNVSFNNADGSYDFPGPTPITSISLSNGSSGTFTFGSGISVGSISISAGSAKLTYSGSYSTGTINISGETGGLKTINGTGTKTNTGITLSNNTGATIKFSGNNLVTNAFSVSGGGTVTLAGTGNTATTLSVTNTNIGTEGITFQRLGGITLNNTGLDGGLTVTGAGTPGSGGTFASTTLTNTAYVSLSWMHLTGSSASGIRGISVTGFTLSNSVLDGTHGDNGNDEGAIIFDGLYGTAGILNNTISGGIGENLRIRNATGSLAITISNNVLTNWRRNAAIDIQGGDASVATNDGTIQANITNNTISSPVTAFNALVGTITGISVSAGTGALAGTASNIVCAYISGNTVDISGVPAPIPPNPPNSAIKVYQSEAATFRLPGYGGGSTNLSAVSNFIAAPNTLTHLVTATSNGTGPGYVGGAACTQ
jgi:hypothetical protein